LNSVDVPSFSPDGRFLAATVANYPRRVREGYLAVPCVWDLKSGASLTEGAWRYATTPEGAATVRGFPIDLSDPWRWKTARDEAAVERLKHYAGVADTVSPDGRFTAAKSLDAEQPQKRGIQIRRTLDDSRVLLLELETNRISSLQFSPDGRWLVSQDFDWKRWRLIVWDVETGASYKTLVNDKAFNGIAFSPDSRLMLVARNHGRLTLYDLSTWESVWTHPELEGFYIRAVTFSQDGSVLAVAHRYDSRIEIWRTGDWVAPVQFDTAGLLPVTSLALSPHGRTLAVGSYESAYGLLASSYNYNGLTGLWSLRTGSPPRRLKEDMSIRDIAFSPDGDWIVTASQDDTNEMRSSGTREGQVRRWNLETLESRALLHREESWRTPRLEHPDEEEILVSAASATNVAFIPVSGNLAGAVYRLSAQTWEGITWVEFESHVDLTFWDPQNDTELKHIDTEMTELYSLAVHPDGSTIATGHENGHVSLWDVATGKKLFGVRSRRARRVTALAFHPKGSALVSGDSEGRLSIWNPKTGEPLSELGGHPEGVEAVAFDATGAHMATASCNDNGLATGRFRVWNASSYEVELEVTGCSRAVRFTPDGRYVVVGGGDGVTRFHGVDDGQVILSLALHPNVDAWLVWTPDGLYDGNEEGIRRILAWRRGTDVYRLNEFPARYHVTDLLPKVLSGTVGRRKRSILEIAPPN